jgi:hypothetical protein
MVYYIPEPDVIYRPSGELERFLSMDALPEKASKAIRALSVDPNIKDVEMRLMEVFIFDNRDPGKGDIYLLALVADGLAPEPLNLVVKGFEGVGDNEALQIGPGGLTIYRNPQGNIPRFLDYRIMVMESDQELRDAGELVEEIRGKDQFKLIKDSLIAMAGVGAPIPALISSAVDLLMGLISQVLKMNKDDQIIYIAGSFNDRIDDLGVRYGLIAQKNRYAKVTYQVLAA